MASFVFKIVSKATGLVLDVPHWSNQAGQPIQLYRQNGGGNQRWQLLENGDGYRIRSLSSSLVLDVPGYDTHDGVEIIQYTDKAWELILDPTTPRPDFRNQLWKIVPATSGYYKIESALSDVQGVHKVLSVGPANEGGGKRLIQMPPNGGDSQLWRLALVEIQPAGRDAIATIQSVSSNLVLSTQTRTIADGEAIVQENASNDFGAGQMWMLAGTNDWNSDINSFGNFAIYPWNNRNVVLEMPTRTEPVGGVSAAVPGGPIHLRTRNGNANQQWSFSAVDEVSSQHFVIQSAYVQRRFSPAGGMQFVTRVLDVPGFSTAAGEAIQGHAPNGGANQKWKVTISDPIR